MDLKTKQAITKAVETANFNELYEKGIGISANESGFYDNLYPLYFDSKENKLYFLDSKTEEAENLIFLGSYSANDILHNDVLSLVHELLDEL
jgi:hypothetical protein